MHVEFIGLPGSGKTTLRRKLLSSLQQDGESRCISSGEAFLEVSKENIDQFLRYPLRFLPHSAALKFARSLVNRSLMQYEAQNRFIARYGTALEAFLSSDTYRLMSVIDKERVIGNFLSMGAHWQCTNTNSIKKKIIFSEEGLVQKSFMFVDHSQRNTVDTDRIHCYLDNIPRTDLVVFVSASAQTCLDRMLDRPDGLTDRLKQADKSTIGLFLKASQAHLDIVIEWLLANRPDSFVILDSEKNIASEFDAIKDKVKQLGA